MKSHFVLTLQIPDIDFKMYPLLAEGILKFFLLLWLLVGLIFSPSLHLSILPRYQQNTDQFFSKQNYSKVLGRGTWRANVA